MIILGAGMAGCLAGVLNKDSIIYEAGLNVESHKSLLRFRTNEIAKAIGIEFRKVKVYKGIWHNDKIVQLSPRYINLYSRKVSDTVSLRSICNLDTVERYIAPINFLDILKDMLGDSIHYEYNLSDALQDDSSPVISTIPIFTLAELLGHKIDIPNRNHPPIVVNKYEIEDTDVHMTYYFTDPTTPVYRASITGSTLIIESIMNVTSTDFNMVIRAFGLTGMLSKQTVQNYLQKNGKLVTIDDDMRKEFIVKFTMGYNIYSLGRLATWLNILLDDVYKDINIIKGLTNKTIYDRIISK